MTMFGHIFLSGSSQSTTSGSNVLKFRFLGEKQEKEGDAVS
jgi:hypothetical protein